MLNLIYVTETHNESVQSVRIPASKSTGGPRYMREIGAPKICSQITNLHKREIANKKTACTYIHFISRKISTCTVKLIDWHS